MKKKISHIIISIICLAAGYFFMPILKKNSPAVQNDQTQEGSEIKTQQEIPSVQNSESEKNKVSKDLPRTTTDNDSTTSKKILQEVPFVVQAPFGNWSDPDFQNGCEEASMIMAMGWIKGEKNIAPAEAQKRILSIIAFENKILGYSADTDAEDMGKIFQQYFKYQNFSVKENPTLDEIKKEIQNGKLVIVPAFGRALGNPNFTQPGPIAHMLVIIGYDPAAKEFITNDPGTRKGASYHYAESKLFDAIWAYPSGSAEPPVPTLQTMKKVMLSISK